MPNIAIVWDFDGTLTPQDSTTIAAEILGAGTSKEFWDTIHKLKGDGDKKLKWQHILASDAPVWMYALSRIAFAKKIPLNAEFFEKFVKPKIELYPNVPAFLRKLKLLEEQELFKSADLKIHYFIVSAGLKDLVEQILPDDLITWTFGSRYRVNAFEGNPAQPESIPVFCMDETMKTRSLFEISKGSFKEEENSVNRRVPPEKRWAPFENIIYVGDGDTDVPSLSLVRSQGGLGVAVYNPSAPATKTNDRLKHMRLDQRTDLITPAKFDASSELFEFLRARCIQIALRYRAEQAI
ncbi:MAG TPA: HAD family hydrolase [Rhizomicrobium sp.]|nr:HAD family hydrolase [Rhizomicrobium sp.]